MPKIEIDLDEYVEQLEDGDLYDLISSKFNNKRKMLQWIAESFDVPGIVSEYRYQKEIAEVLDDDVIEDEYVKRTPLAQVLK